MELKFTSSPLSLTSFTGIGNYATGKEIDSIFTTENKYYRFETGKYQRSVLSNEENIHTNDVYDTSTFNILKTFNEKSGPLQLRPADFAYNRDFGVYPNNRLIILRRFANPIPDDIYSIPDDKKGPGKPISTIVGYVKDTDDFMNFDVNEEWIKADASFKEILNKVGDDVGFGKFKIGDILARGNNIIPMPGATELLQRKLLVAFGLIDPNESAVIPSGDPNLIKDAKVRDLVSDGDAGSGLNGKISVSFEVTYEQKFIDGVDPTLVYMDILGTLLAMGTSRSKFYLGGNENTRLNKKIKEFIHNPTKTIKEFIKATITAFGGAIKKLKELFNTSLEAVADDDGSSAYERFSRTAREQFQRGKSYLFGDETKAEDAAKATSEIQNVMDNITDYIGDFISSKYRVQALGVFSALSGAPSTPWHVTIGNPLRPVFCSGDMLCTKIGIKEGPQLSFNDLPTYITATIELQSARDQGLQEIFTKFNSGGMRTSSVSTTSKDKSGWLIKPGPTFWSKSYGLTASASGIVSDSVDASTTNATNTVDQTKVSEQVDKIQPDPSFAESVVDVVEDTTEDIREGAVAALDYAKDGAAAVGGFVSEKAGDLSNFVSGLFN
jgi:hypothetical protein